MRIRKKAAMSYIAPCVLTIIICMILTVMITFVNAVSIVKQTERNSRVVLDNYVITNAIEIYDDIKRGYDDDIYPASSSYISALTDFCTFERSGSYLYHIDGEGNEEFKISVPQMYCSEKRKLKLYITYTVYVPIYFCGVKVTTAAVPVTVESKYIEKF